VEQNVPEKPIDKSSKVVFNKIKLFPLRKRKSKRKRDRERELAFCNKCEFVLV